MTLQVLTNLKRRQKVKGGKFSLLARVFVSCDRFSIFTQEALSHFHVFPPHISLSLSVLQFSNRGGCGGPWGPGLPCPQDLFKIMQFSGNFREKPIF